MWIWFHQQQNSLWFSLAPLILINFFGLLTVVVFSFLSKKNTSILGAEELELRHHSKFLNKWIKEYWFWVTSPLVRLALKLKLSPNFFTTLGFLLSIGAAVAFSYGRVGLAGWCVILGGTCDMFDGRIARITKRSSSSGAFYDSVMDRYGELVCLVGLASYYRDHWMLWVVLATIVGSMMVSYTRARGEAVGVLCDKGLMQRPERIVYLGVGAIFSPLLRYFIAPYWVTDQEYLLIAAVALIALMTNLTALYRMIWIYRKLQLKVQPLEPVEKGMKEKDKVTTQHPLEVSSIVRAIL